jgi:polysaccharide pyruvyl transferase WcaK-like protein
MRVLVTEAYSPKNLGDSELVHATLNAVERMYPNALVSLVALDTAGFSAMLPNHEVLPRVFDRQLLRERVGRRRVVLLGGWLWVAGTMLLCSLTSQPFARRLLPVVAAFSASKQKESLRAYARSAVIIPCGGGFLADRYWRESLLTGLTWRWATAMGCEVETMPISVEFTNGLTGRLFAWLASRVRFRVRDSSSFKCLERLGISSELFPDLAFRNVLGTVEDRRGTNVLIFPVGGDYFEPGEWRGHLRTIADSVSAYDSNVRVLVSSMHGPLDGGIAGFDEEAVAVFAGLCSASVIPPHNSYVSLCETMANSSDIVVSSRMHAGIAALCAGRRLVLLGYEEKHSAMMADLGLREYSIPLSELSVERLRAVISLARLADVSTFHMAAILAKARLSAGGF